MLEASIIETVEAKTKEYYFGNHGVAQSLGNRLLAGI